MFGQLQFRPHYLDGMRAFSIIMLVLPETDESDAIKIAERCHTLICKERILYEKSEVIPMVTVSLGVGTIIPTENDDPIRFIDEVDKWLYQAKQRGRNCIANGD